MSFLTYLTKTFFSLKPFLEMIGKVDFFNLLYIKSKTAFKTSFQPLSKLVEQLKIRLRQKFEMFLLINKIVIIIFLKFAAPQTWHTFKGCIITNKFMGLGI